MLAPITIGMASFTVKTEIFNSSEPLKRQQKCIFKILSASFVCCTYLLKLLTNENKQSEMGLQCLTKRLPKRFSRRQKLAICCDWLFKD